MAGCECEKETWKLSYENEVAAVALANPAFTSHDIRVEAARIFRPRYKSDIESKANEQLGLTEYDTGVTFTMTDDGKLIYTNKGYEGVEIEDFSLNQLKLTPKQYSLREHQTSLAIRDAFRSGATDVVTSYIRQGQDNRDIVEMRYDPEAKIGRLFIRNTNTSGQNHNAETVRGIAKQEFSTLRESAIAPDVFILSDKPVESTNIHQIATRVETVAMREIHDMPGELRQGDSQEVIDKKPEVIRDISKTAELVVAKTIRETTRTAVAAAVFVKKELFTAKKKPVERAVSVRHPLEQQIKVQSERVMSPIKKEKKPEKKIRRIIEALIPPIYQRQPVPEVKTAAPKKMLEIVNQYRLKNIYEFIKIKTERPVFVETLKMSPPKKDQFVKPKVEKVLEKRVVSKTKQERKIFVPEIHLVRRLIRMIRAQESRKQKQQKERRTEKLIPKNENVIKFSIAWITWILLEPKLIPEVKTEKKSKHEKIIVKEPSPWILLSIIWYLAAIREQGMQKKTKIKKVKKQSPLPQNGIIFAASS